MAFFFVLNIILCRKKAKASNKLNFYRIKNKMP